MQALQEFKIAATVADHLLLSQGKCCSSCRDHLLLHQPQLSVMAAKVWHAGWQLMMHAGLPAPCQARNPGCQQWQTQQAKRPPHSRSDPAAHLHPPGRMRHCWALLRAASDEHQGEHWLAAQAKTGMLIQLLTGERLTEQPLDTSSGLQKRLRPACWVTDAEQLAGAQQYLSRREVRIVQPPELEFWCAVDCPCWW